MELDLFGYKKSSEERTLENARLVNGLGIHFDFISQSEENLLLTNIDKNAWLDDLKRRVQHYGYKYDYKARRIDKSFYIGEIPDWMHFLYERLQRIVAFRPDQAIVNEYIDSQGIAPHIDCEPCFGDTIVSISLGSHCVMNFQKATTSKEKDKIPLFIPPRTLLIMTGESRLSWFHGIPPRKTDKFNDEIYKRGRRVSITFRSVILK